MKRPGRRRRKSRALASAQARLVNAFESAYPPRGPCFFCGPTHDARHRLIDAIRSRHRAGDSVAGLAADYGFSEAKIRLATETSLT